MPCVLVPESPRFAGATPDELDQLRVHCMTTVLPYLTGYIWQQDPFTLQSSTTTKSPWSNASLRTAHTKDADAEASAYLWGVTRFGDNIEDEWLIVWLLYQITIKVESLTSQNLTLLLALIPVPCTYLLKCIASTYLACSNVCCSSVTYLRAFGTMMATSCLSRQHTAYQGG